MKSVIEQNNRTLEAQSKDGHTLESKIEQLNSDKDLLKSELQNEKKEKKSKFKR